MREVLKNEVDLRANGLRIVPMDQESRASVAYRTRMNAQGSPTEMVAAGYVWSPGSELVRRDGAMSQEASAE